MLLSLSVSATPLLSHVERLFPRNDRRRPHPFKRRSWGHLKPNHHCFPANALVNLLTVNKTVQIDKLKVGDIVATGNGRSSSVYTFTHAERNGVYNFVSMKTSVGTLLASPGHHVYNGRGIVIAAHNVRAGETLLHSKNGPVLVQSVKTIQARGLYNPQTLDSRLIVGGFIVSTFTEAIEERVAQSLLAPLRTTFMITNRDFSAGSIASHGVIRSGLLALLNILSN